MSTHNIQFHDKIRKQSLNICFPELLEGIVGTRKRVQIIQGKWAIRVRAVEVILYMNMHVFILVLWSGCGISRVQCWVLTLVMLNKFKRPLPLLIFSQSDNLIQIVDINSNTEWQTVQIQISWLLQKPTDLDLHCLQSRVYPGSPGPGLTDAYPVNSRHVKFSLRKHAYSNILKISPPKTESFQIKNLIYFSYFCSKHRLWVLVRTASVRQF